MFRYLLLSALFASTLAAIRSPPRRPYRVRRHLEDADGGDDAAEEEADISWLADYNVVYTQCSSTQQSVVYKICPRYDGNGSGRNSCSVDCDDGAEYLASLADFVDAFTEAQMEARAYRCEMARENCQYDDDGSCYDSDASGYDLSYCQDDWDEALDIQEWLECQQLEAQDDDGNADGGEDDGVKYYIGPYCSEDNYSLHLGVFTDADCTVRADDDSAYGTMNDGATLPYSAATGESLVGSDAGNGVEENEYCASCREHAKEEDQNDGDQQDQDDVLEQCEDLYGYTFAKCEDGLNIDDADSSDCEEISEIKNVDIVTSDSVTTGNGSRGRLRGWLVFLFIALCAGAAVSAYVRHRRKRRGQAAASGQGETAAVEEKPGPSNKKLIE